MGYMRTALSKDNIKVLYKVNNIEYELCSLFNDYVQSLFALIFDTYMGDDFTPKLDRLKHFSWCWLKNNDNFKKEGIIFEYNEETYIYFLDFINEIYYNVKNKEKQKHLPITIRTMWLSILLYDIKKSRSDLDNFIEIYKLIKKTLKK